MPAFLDAWRAGLFRRDHILRNVGAGLVVGVVALPLAMAFAIASGAQPQQGLYTALVASVVVALLGGTRVQIAGPTGAFAVMLAGVTAKYGLGGLQVVTLLAGAMLLLFGVTRIGGVIRYVPESVVLGFTAGIAIVIWVGQWQNFLGLPAVQGEALYEKLPGLIAALAHVHPATAMLGVASLLVVVFWSRLPLVGHIPAPLVALLGGTVAVAIAHPAGVATIGSVFGGIPSGLPSLTPPHVTFATALSLLRPAFAIALLGAIESLLSATVSDGLVGTRHDPNQELLGQGLANVAAGLFGGFAATGAIARTATSVRHGGSSPVAGIVHSVVVALVLVVGLLYVALRRWREVLVVLTTLPNAFVGGLVALWLTGETWNISSIVGMIGLFGVAVQNSLVLIRQAEDLRFGGLPFIDSVREASLGRVRPKLMTAGSAMLGLSPMLFGLGGSELERPLAIVMVGGLVTSTLYTLVALPSVYGWVGRYWHETARAGSPRS